MKTLFLKKQVIIMIISHIRLVNFGIYKGVNNYSFDVKKDKNVVVVNGNNGSGKTTLMEALKISLYGPYYLGYQTHNDNYYRFIENKLNAYALEYQDSEFSLEIGIFSWEKGKKNEYSVKREWFYNHDQLKETVDVSKNGKWLDHKEKESFFSQLQTHLPLNLFNVFFFDGEQLDRLFILNDKNENLEEFHNLFSTLFNIDLFQHLKGDLRKYLKQKNVYSHLSSHEKEYTHLHEQYENLESAIFNNEEQISLLKADRDAYLEELTNLEGDFRSVGGLNDENSNAIKQKITALEEEKKHLDFENKNILNEYLPFLLLSEELSQLLFQLESERTNREFRIMQKNIQRDDLHLFLDGESGLEKNEVSAILEKLKEFFNPDEDHSLKHDLSSKDYYFIKALKEEANRISPGHLRKNFTAIDRINEDIFALQQQLTKSQSSETEEILQKIKETQQKITQLDEAIQQSGDRLNALNNDLHDMNEKMLVLRKTIIATKKDENIFTMLDRVNRVIDRFVIESKRQKFKKLEHYATQMFQNLIRKDDFIKGIRINSENGDIRIINSLNKEMPAKNLSAGERQIYVLSLLWGVLKISDKRIPLVFDTLLGRLDKSHKENILKNFLNTVGEQVIILATDSELNDESIMHLTPYINQSYTIDFNSKDRDVTITKDEQVINYGV